MRRINLLGLVLVLSGIALCSGCNNEPEDIPPPPPMQMRIAPESIGVNPDPYIDESLVVGFAVEARNVAKYIVKGYQSEPETGHAGDD